VQRKANSLSKPSVKCNVCCGWLVLVESTLSEALEACGPGLRHPPAGPAAVPRRLSRPCGSRMEMRSSNDEPLLQSEAGAIVTEEYNTKLKSTFSGSWAKPKKLSRESEKQYLDESEFRTLQPLPTPPCLPAACCLVPWVAVCVRVYLRVLSFGGVDEAWLSTEEKMWVVLHSTVILWLLIGACFYMFFEGWGFHQALFYAVNVGLGIGYGEMVVHGPGAMLFTILYCVMGSCFIASTGGLLLKAVMDQQDEKVAEAHLAREAALCPSLCRFLTPNPHPRHPTRRTQTRSTTTISHTIGKMAPRGCR
jgi:hypothetical protein